MKKFFAIIMTFVMAFILVGCKKTPELSFEVTSYNMSVGDEVTLKPTIVNLEGNDLVEYKVTGEGIIEIKNSKVKALKEGQVTVEASLKDYEEVPSVTLTIKVSKVAVTDIKISGPNKVRKGLTITLKAETIPANATYKDVTWKSLDETKATIDEKGLVTAKEIGKVKLEATIDGFKKEIEIEVLKPLATDIELKGEEKMVIGTEQTLVVSLTPEDAEKEVAFESDDVQTATVDKDGKVKALKLGTVTITATMGSLESSFTIEIIKQPVEKVTVSGAKELTAGDTLQLTAKVEPTDAEQAITWVSSDPTIATVDEKGLVTTLKGGTVTITAKAANEKEGSVELTIKDYNKELIIVDATFEAGKEFKEGEIDYKVGFNAFTTLKEACEKANDGSKIVVRKGTYAEDVIINKQVTIEGPNKGLDPDIDERVEEAIITGIVKLDGVKDVKIDGLRFTGKAQILSTDAQLENIELVNLLVDEKGEATSVWDENTRNYDATAFITLVSGSNDNLHKNILIKNSLFDIRDGAIKLGRVEDITIDGNVFSNFERDAIRFPGGYNGGKILIVNNMFINDKMQGYNAIFLASYGDNEGKAPVEVTVKDNYFCNIGVEKEGVTYTGVLSAKTYQELGAKFIVDGNELDNVVNGFRVRSNATEANHKEFPWSFVATHNIFNGVPSGIYFNNRVTSSDTDKTAPAKAIFDGNLFLDNEGKPILEPDMTKILNAKEVKNNFKSIDELNKAYFGITFDFNMLVSGDLATVEDGSRIAFLGKEFTVGKDAFGTIDKALEKARDGNIIYVMPGSYAEDLVVDKEVILFGGLGEQKAIYSGKMVLGSNVKIDGLQFEKDCEIEIKEEKGIAENISITRNIFKDPKSSVDAFISINSETHNLEFSHNTVINPRKPRFIRAYEPVYGLEMIGNDLGGSKAIFDYVRMDKGFGGNVTVIGNTFGTTQQSGFMVMSHMPGNFLFMDNKFIDQQNVAIDIRTLAKGFENPRGTLNIIHNVFDRTSFTGSPWGCIRIRYKGYNENDIKVNVNYNTFINWGLEDVVQDAGDYKKPLVNADNNYFEGITAENIEANAAKLLSNFGLSWKNPFATPEALEEAYKLLATKVEVTISKPEIKVDEEAQLTVKILPETIKQDYEILLLNDGIVSISDTGLIKGLREGKAIIRIISKDGSGRFTDVYLNVLPWEGIKIGEKKYDTIDAALAEAKENDVIMVHGLKLEQNITLPKGVTLDGGGNPKDKATIIGKVIMPSNTTLKNFIMEGKSCIEIKDETLAEKIAIMNCVFDNVASPVDAFISINTETKDFTFTGNEAISPRKPRFIRAYENVIGFTMKNNTLGDSKTAVYDYVRFDKALGGEVQIINNYVGSNSQSAFRIAAHLPGNFIVKNNVFNESKNTSFDLRANKNVSETDKINIVFEHNEFHHGTWGEDVIWGCIRIGLTGYKPENVTITANYNIFTGWGEVDVIENNSGEKFVGEVLNADNNFIEGITSENMDAKKVKLFGGLAKSTANTFDSADALIEAYNKLPKE